jgi:hypothetical protein
MGCVPLLAVKTAQEGVEVLVYLRRAQLESDAFEGLNGLWGNVRSLSCFRDNPIPCLAREIVLQRRGSLTDSARGG